MQERTVLDQVTKDRAKATGVTIDASQLSDPAAFQRFQQAQDALSGSLGRLLAVSERYPDLKSNQNFLALQSQLEGTENRIAIARRDYNAAVQDYNTTLRVLPTSIWAHTFYSSAKPMQLFTATEGAQSAPQVQFNFNQPAAAAPGSAPPTPAPANAAQ
jgi:LemA protein